MYSSLNSRRRCVSIKRTRMSHKIPPPFKRGKPHTSDPGVRVFHIIKHADPYGETYIPRYDELLREFAGQY